MLSQVERDLIAQRCQRILAICESQQSAANAPLFAGQEQRTMLLSYIQAALSTLEVKAPEEEKNQFDARIRAQRAQQNSIKKQFKTQFTSQVLCDEVGEPTIFFLIQQELKQVEKQNKILRIQTLFPYNVNDLNTLQDSQFQQIYSKTERVIQQFEATKNVIATLCSRAGLPTNTVEVLICCKNQLLSTNENALVDPLHYLEISLLAPNEAIGYSIYNLLVIAKILPEQPFAGNLSKHYNDPMVFTLNYDEFTTLQKDLGDLTKWYRDFENILSALFASDAATYVKTGCKPLHEAVTTEIGRENAHLMPLLNRDVRDRFSQHQNDPFLLFGQCAIDLTSHPAREQIRDLLQRIYSLCDLKDSKNEAKTFVRDQYNQVTFTSLLNVVQVKKIYNEIMALSELSKSAKEMGFNSVFDYVELVGSTDIKEFYHNYLQLVLHDIAMTNTPNQPNENIGAKRRRLEIKVSQLFPAPNSSVYESFADIQKRFHTATQNYLNATMNIECHRAVARDDLVPTAQEKNALLGNGSVEHTIAKLKASPNYRILADAYALHYQSLGAQPRAANQTQYNAGFIYMYPTLDECLDKLCHEFNRRQLSDELTYAKQAWLSTVMKIVYAEKMQIPPSALKRAAERFGDIFKIEQGRDDLGSGCNQGLAGRCLLIESQLIAGEDNLFMQFIRQLLIDNVEQSFADTIASINASESSMATRVKPMIMEYVGLAANTTGRNTFGTDYTANIKAFMTDLATRYNPGSIYAECFQYLSNEFKRCARENDAFGMDALLTSLKFSPETDAESLQIDSKWNIKRFEVFLPQRVIQLLQEKTIINNNPSAAGHLVIEATNTHYSFNQAISAKQQRMQTNTHAVANPNRLFRSAAVPLNPVPPPMTAANAWSNGGLFSPPSTNPQRQTNNNAMDVDLTGDSNRSNEPHTGSTG